MPPALISKLGVASGQERRQSKEENKNLAQVVESE